MSLTQPGKEICLILSDVDGVLTDGGIEFNAQGVETKRFSVRDGLGVKLWKNAGHDFGIITARDSSIVKNRAEELGIEMVHQGCKDKLATAMQIIDSLKLQANQVAYIGDDLPDLAVIKHVGFGVAVADACDEVKESACWITQTDGGLGAVRELVEFLLKQQERWQEVIAPFINK